MSWKSVSSCMFLTFRKSKILKYSEKVWVHGHSCSLYIPIRNIQGLTPSHFWHFLAPFVKKCMSLYVSGPLTTDQEHTRTGTFWWKGVSPCTFLANSYRLREYTRTHTFSLNIWWKGVTPCMFLPHTIQPFIFKARNLSSARANHYARVKLRWIKGERRMNPSFYSRPHHRSFIPGGYYMVG